MNGLTGIASLRSSHATHQIMTPGHNLILRLPSSGKLVKIETIASGNTCGARYWSDGKSECPMLPERLWLRVHPENRELFWEDECEKVDREAPWEDSKKYPKVPFAEEPGLDDYRLALDQGVAISEEQKHYILTHFWWSANDPIRHKQKDAKRPDDFRDKLIELRSMLDLGAPEERVTAAEIARELGDFEVAVGLLDYPLPGNLSYYVRKFKEWSVANDTMVREMRDRLTFRLIPLRL